MSLFTPAHLAAAVLALLGLLLACAVWSDARRRRIPNRLVLAGAVLGLACNGLLPEGAGFAAALPGGLGFGQALAGLGAGLALMLPLYLLRAMGAGDVKLMAMTGAFLGPQAMPGVLLATFIAGGVLILAVVLARGSLGLLLANLKTMLLSGYFRLVLHELPVLEAAPVPAGRLPYALAIAAGTLIYLTLRMNGRLPPVLEALG